MTIKCGCTQQSPQILTSELDDKIVIDRQTFKKLSLLLGRCASQLEGARDNEIFLASLNDYLSKSDSDEARKAHLLLRAWLDVVPEALEEAAGWLDEVSEIAKAILSASKLGGRDD